MLVRLLYASRTAVGFSTDELNTILKQSRTHNHERGVTGVLCYSEGVFMQVLEGSRDAVNALYKDIVNDPRHTDVVILKYTEINEREFAGWSMGQVTLSRLNPGLVLKYGESSRLDPYRMSGHALMALFNELVSSGAIVSN
jgi:hypothetical protein